MAHGKWFKYLNGAIAGFALLLLLAGIITYFQQPRQLNWPDLSPKKRKLPPNSFHQPQASYDAIGTPFLQLQFSPLSIRLPDLRRHLLYYGQNSRPDADPETAKLHFSLSGNKETTSIAPGEKLYLLYSPNQARAHYTFSPDNRPTSLWIEARPKKGEAIIHVTMQSSTGQLVQQPAAHAQFSLRQLELARLGSTIWEIGKLRVDATLLARQRARWYGQDLFLELHGGEEFADVMGKQRIDFEREEGNGSVFVTVGDLLIWKDGRWQRAPAGSKTRPYSLMQIQKIEERLMRLHLWDPTGQVKVTLNLLKSNESWAPQHITNNFRFVGARTRSQFLFEVGGERITLSPQDWLLLVEGKWRKLLTAEEIDDYVERKQEGILFVVGEVLRRGEQQFLSGTLYSPSRTQLENVEIPIQQGAAITAEEKTEEAEEESLPIH